MAGRLIALSTLLCCLSAAGAFPEDARRNVLLISIDTMRADFLGCNGSGRVRTPHLDGLARGGVNFTRARSPVPLTLPAHASILTGNYPPTHGARDNGTYRVSDDQVTLAEVLKERGYVTAAFTGAFVLDRRFGLAQGFDVYDDGALAGTTVAGHSEAERGADAVLAAFAQWLRSYDGRQPFFAWVHFFDPHAPYAPPEPYRSRYRQDPYAGEVAYTDAVVGKVVESLESRGLLDTSLLAVVGDHGEGLGEHEETTHSLLIYNSTLHVPMLVYGPGLIPPGRTIEELARIIDLAPTILDYLGVEGPFGQGASLRSLIEEDAPSEERVSYTESLYPRLNLGWSELRGLEVGTHRFILAPEPELYDLEADPGERMNLIQSDPERARELRRRLEELVESMPSRDTTRAIDPETRAKLQSLGYVVGSPSGGDAADPKDKMVTWNRIHRATSQFVRGAYVEAVETLEELRKTEKDIPLVYEYLGSSYMYLQEHAAAERVYREALGRGLGSADVHLNLGLILFDRGDRLGARQELERALRLDPLNVSAHFRLGNLYRDEGRRLEAIEHYEKALELDPDHPLALSHLCVALTEGGLIEESLTRCRAALEASPDDAPALNALGIALAQSGDLQQAVPHLERAVEIAPSRFEYQFNLGRVLAAQGSFAAALPRFEEAVRLSAGREPTSLNMLAAAYAEMGLFARAVEAAGRAADAAERQGDDRLAQEARARKAQYEAAARGAAEGPPHPQ